MLCLHQTPRKTCFRKQETEHINQPIQNESTPGCYVRLSLLSLQPTRSNHNCFWMSSWGSPLLDPKKLQSQQFYIIDWIRKKLLVDVANLATCCHDYDVLLEVLGTLGKCYVSNPVAKTLVWIENHDWHNGTGCYVNESVPELIYALLDFMGVYVYYACSVKDWISKPAIFEYHE